MCLRQDSNSTISDMTSMGVQSKSEMEYLYALQCNNQQILNVEAQCAQYDSAYLRIRPELLEVSHMAQKTYSTLLCPRLC